jgi:hypothetical protein
MCSTHHASSPPVPSVSSQTMQSVSQHPWHCQLRLVFFLYQTGHKTILRMSILIILLASLERNRAIYMHCDSDIGRKERSCVAITNTSLSILANLLSLCGWTWVTLPAYLLNMSHVMDAFLSSIHYMREREKRSCVATLNQRLPFLANCPFVPGVFGWTLALPVCILVSLRVMVAFISCIHYPLER